MSFEELKAYCKESIFKVIDLLSENVVVRLEMRLKVHRTYDSITRFEGINERKFESLLERCFYKVWASDLNNVMCASLIFLLSHSSVTETASEDSEFFHEYHEVLNSERFDPPDLTFPAFVRYMRTALMVFSPANNEGKLLMACAFLEGLEPGSRILNYSLGKGMTNATKRRLLAYDWFSSKSTINKVKISRDLKGELSKSQELVSSRRKTGNQTFTITLKAGELEKMIGFKRDFYDQVLDEIRPHFLSSSESFKPHSMQLFLHIGILFSDIPYFETIMLLPITDLISQLEVWLGNESKSKESLPNELHILQNRIKNIPVKGTEIMTMTMAMLACKVLYLQRNGFMNIVEAPPMPMNDLLIHEDVVDELRFLHNFYNAISLVHDVTGNRRLKVNQTILLELGQRLEGSGRKYTKGGGKSQACTRRIELIKHVTGKIQTEMNNGSHSTTSAAATSENNSVEGTEQSDMQISGENIGLINSNAVTVESEIDNQMCSIDSEVLRACAQASTNSFDHRLALLSSGVLPSFFLDSNASSLDSDTSFTIPVNHVINLFKGSHVENNDDFKFSMEIETLTSELVGMRVERSDG